MKPNQPLSARSTISEISIPFERDVMGRKPIAEKITSYVDRLHAGAVIGISAPWGEGKTYFGRNWHAQLKETHRVAFIDAFENDYLDDPFLLIASELSELIHSGDKQQKLKSRAAQVLKAIMPIGTKALVNLASRVLLGTSDLSEAMSDAGKDIAETLADRSEKWLVDRFDEMTVQRASLQGFKDALKEAVEQENKPVVVFIDELDRCKPSFAVTLIERLKHLFDVPNLVFVLLLNKTQLERSIEGYYGAGTDGNAYLGKFVNLWFDLPRPIPSDSYHDRRIQAFVEASLEAYNVPQDRRKAADSFRDECALWTQLWGMSLRDIERMCTLFSLDGMSGQSLATYLIAMKVKDASMFGRLHHLDKAAHIQCAQTLESSCSPIIKGLDPGYPESLYRGLAELHRVLVGDLNMEDAPLLRNWRKELFGSFHHADRAFRMISDRLDLPISMA